MKIIIIIVQPEGKITTTTNTLEHLRKVWPEKVQQNQELRRTFPGRNEATAANVALL